jgi:hypothetical protein
VASERAERRLTAILAADARRVAVQIARSPGFLDEVKQSRAVRDDPE